LKNLLAEEGSGEVCGTLARIMHEFAEAKQPEDDAGGERADWKRDAETLESLSGQFIN
jgi:hypothetical protein